MDKNNCTILVNSCDKYDDTWYPFFKLFKLFWPDCQFPIVLNTERKKYCYPGLNIRTFDLYDNNHYIIDSWSDRLLKILSRIDSKFIIFLLDDFFIKDTINKNTIEKLLTLMQNNQDIGAIYLMPMNPINTQKDLPCYFNDINVKDCFYERAKLQTKHIFLRDFFKPYEKKNMDGLYVVNAQASIWRKSTLIKTLKHGESAWDWEVYGTIRATKMKEKFLEKRGDLVFNYDFDKGNGIMTGLWVPETVIPLFKKHNINIDLSIRGVKTVDWNYKKNKNIFKKIKTIFHMVRCLFHS